MLKTKIEDTINEIVRNIGKERSKEIDLKVGRAIIKAYPELISEAANKVKADLLAEIEKKKLKEPQHSNIGQCDSHHAICVDCIYEEAWNDCLDDIKQLLGGE